MFGSRKFIRLLSLALVPLISVNLIGLSVAHAKLVSTETVLREEAQQISKARILEALDREDVQLQLQEMGVDADEARLRVAALTDEEVEQLAKQIENDPTGEGLGAAVSVAITVVVVILVLDLLCVTNLLGIRSC